MESVREFDFVHECISDHKKLQDVLNKIVDKYNKIKDNVKISKVNDEYLIHFGSDTSSITVHIHLNSHSEVYLSNKHYMMLLVAKMNFKTSKICQKLNSLVLLKKKELENDLDKLLIELNELTGKKEEKIEKKVEKDSFWKTYFLIFAKGK